MWMTDLSDTLHIWGSLCACVCVSEFGLCKWKNWFHPNMTVLIDWMLKIRYLAVLCSVWCLCFVASALLLSKLLQALSLLNVCHVSVRLDLWVSAMLIVHFLKTSVEGTFSQNVAYLYMKCSYSSQGSPWFVQPCKWLNMQCKWLLFILLFTGLCCLVAFLNVYMMIIPGFLCSGVTSCWNIK